MAAAQRKPKPPAKPGAPPCRNCGTCDHCLGLTAPEGTKVCRKCRETKPVADFYPRGNGYRNQCRACMVGSHSQRKECADCGRNFWGTSGMTRCKRCQSKTATCAHCGKAFTRSVELRLYCSADCRDSAARIKRAATWAAQRLAALLAYSHGAEPACSCCGERERVFLAIDHINGGGNKHHQETGGGGFYVWLRKHGYPEGFRILCHNCNFGRQLNGGTCPHEQAN